MAQKADLWFLLLTPVLYAQVPAVSLLQPNAKFDLESKLPAEYKGFAIAQQIQSTSAGLHFLISPNARTPAQAVLTLDGDGQLAHLIPLPGRVQAGYLDVDSRGIFYVLKFPQPAEPTPDTLLAVSLDGKVSRTLAMSRRVAARRITDGKLISIGVSGDVKWSNLDSGVEGPTDLRIDIGDTSGPLLMKEVAPNRTILIETKRLLAHFIDNTVPTHRVFSISGPDVDNCVKAYGPEVINKAVFVSDVTSDLKGHIYLLLSAYSLADGAPVLELNERFETIRRFRCILPKIMANRVVGNAEGYFSASRLAVFHGSLYLLDRKGFVVRYTP